jgi:ABC-type amino acid transport substrate-binding protein
MGYKVIFTILILSTFFTVSYAGEKIVNISTLGDYAPFCMADENYEINQVIPMGRDAVGFQGYSWDVVRESFHEMGYTIHLSIRPWPRALFNLKNAETDILFPTGVNTERKQIFHYSEESTNQANFLVYVRTGNQFEWKGLNSLNGLTIGVKREFNYGDIWRTNTSIKKHDISTIWQGFQMLDAGRIDGFLGYEANWGFTLKQHNWNHKFKKLPAFDSTAEYLVTIKSNPNGKEFLKDFDTGKRRLIKNGKFRKITSKWFGNSKTQ